MKLRLAKASQLSWGLAWISLVISVTPKEVESIEISHALKSFLHIVIGALENQAENHEETSLTKVDQYAIQKHVCFVGTNNGKLQGAESCAFVYFQHLQYM